MTFPGTKYSFQKKIEFFRIFQFFNRIKTQMWSKSLLNVKLHMILLFELKNANFVIIQNISLIGHEKFRKTSYFVFCLKF